MTPTPAPTPESRLDSILEHIGSFLELLLPIAQAVASPFLKSQKTIAIVNQELPVAEATAQALAGIGKQ